MVKHAKLVPVEMYQIPQQFLGRNSHLLKFDASFGGGTFDVVLCGFLRKGKDGNLTYNLQSLKYRVYNMHFWNEGCYT